MHVEILCKTKLVTEPTVVFFHLTGTKIVPKKPYQQRNSYQKEERNDYNNKHQQNFESRNRFEVLSENPKTQNSNDEVFQQPMPSDKITLADIMKELIGIKVRQDLQERNQSRTR